MGNRSTSTRQRLRFSRRGASSTTLPRRGRRSARQAARSWSKASHAWVVDRPPRSGLWLAEEKSRTGVSTAAGRSRLAHGAKPLLQKVSARSLRLQLLNGLAEEAGITSEEAAQLTEIRIPRG